jgi:predicted phage tail protein
LQTIERVVHGAGASAALAAPVFVSDIVALGVGMLLVGVVLTPGVSRRGRASPQFLQRFLF